MIGSAKFRKHGAAATLWRGFALSIAAIVLAGSAGIAEAARAPKKSWEACHDLAVQRGFTAGNHGAMAKFISACRQGKQS